MTDLESQIREFVSGLRHEIAAPPDLHSQVMQRIRTQPRAVDSAPWRRQVALSLALVAFVGMIAIGLSELRHNGSLTGERATSSPVPAVSPTTSEPSPAPFGPDARFGAAMAYDAALGVSILFGGRGVQGEYLDDTWSWNGETWTRLHPKASPPMRVGGQAVYDEARRTILLYGGTGGRSVGSNIRLSDLWSWDGNNWTELHPRHVPQVRVGAALGYDRDIQAAVLFGGDAGGRVPVFLNDLWLWTGSDWIEQHPASLPPARSDGAMVFDPDLHVILLFGGGNGVPLNDTWAWDGRTWHQLKPSNSPSGRLSASAAYDSSTRSVVVFGGQGFINPANGEIGALSDTWTWDGNTWERQAAGGPLARWMASMCYDAARREVVLFGGWAPTKTGPPLRDAWLWDGARWR